MRHDHASLHARAICFAQTIAFSVVTVLRDADRRRRHGALNADLVAELIKDASRLNLDGDGTLAG
jgi:hypothetical protein